MKVEAMSFVAQHDRAVAQILELEAKRQAGIIDLVASENHADCAILEGSRLPHDDKYAEEDILGIVITVVAPI